MATTITCPQCGLQGHLPDGNATAQTQCPRCGTVVAVPASAAGPPPAPTPEAPPTGGQWGPINPALDLFFAAAFHQRPAPPAPPDPTALPGSGSPGAPLLPGPPPHAEHEALREERLRFQAYVRHHMTALEQQRQEFDSYRMRTEGELAQRERELRELESQIRRELERQEEELARQRRELQEWRDQMVQDSAEKDALRRKVGTLARELERLRANSRKPPENSDS